MSITEMYYYLFYKFYKLFAAFKPKVWTADMSAVTVVLSLEIALVFPLSNYYDVFFHRQEDLELFSLKILIPFILILVIKWFAFWRNDKWKDYVSKFDQWPEDKNSSGTHIVVWLTLIILANFVFSFYLDPPPGGW